MKTSKTAIRELGQKYSLILKKCFILNMSICLCGALPAMAQDRIVTTERRPVPIPSDVTFENLESEPQGGAIEATTNITVTNDTFTNNSTQQDGGAIYLNTSNDRLSSITGSVFQSNSALGYDKANGGAVSLAKGRLSVSDSTFEGNKGVLGGAIYAADPDRQYSELSIDGSTFTGNEADMGGALATNASRNLLGRGGTEITNSRFIKNKATNVENLGGGAIYAAESGALSLSDAAFTDNESASSGGAISTYHDNRTANLTTIDIVNATFVGNKAAKEGGALNNYMHNSLNQLGTVTIANTLFDGNSADKGGAIYNHKEGDRYGLAGDITVTDGIFINNSARIGGAIYNDGNLTLSGNTLFANNTSDGGYNDIYNDGHLQLGGTVTLDGGIIGNGTTEILRNTTLSGMTMADTPIITNSVIDNKGNAVADLSFIVPNGVTEATYAYIQANDTWKGDDFILSDNAKENTLYNIQAGTEKGTITVSKKSMSEIMTALEGEDPEIAQSIAAIAEAKPMNPQAQAIAEAITISAQTGGKKTASQLAKTVNPLKNAIIQHQTLSTNRQIFTVASTRMDSAPMGQSGGQNGGSVADFRFGPWVQGLYNKAHNRQEEGYRGYSRGIAAGLDVDVTENLMLGFGYGYTATDIKADEHKTQDYAHNIFIYGKYQPSRWHTDMTLNFGHARYKDNALGLVGKYHVDSIAGSALLGYKYGMFDPYIGARYTLADPDNYSNGLIEVHNKRVQVGTAMIGTKIAKRFKLTDWMDFEPEVKIAGTYDVKSDNTAGLVGVVGGMSSYLAGEKRLKRAALETGIRLKTTIKQNLSLTLIYDAALRSKMTAQTGGIKLQYHF